MSDLYAVLLSWAVTLSGFPVPKEPPEIIFKPHAFFVESACNGQECKVWGWFAGGKRLYIDEGLNPQTTLGASVVVHEMVHYLQAVERGDDNLPIGQAFSAKPSCQQAVAWERQAYAVQKEFIHRAGRYIPVGQSFLTVTCDPHADETPAEPVLTR